MLCKSYSFSKISTSLPSLLKSHRCYMVCLEFHICWLVLRYWHVIYITWKFNYSPPHKSHPNLFRCGLVSSSKLSQRRKNLCRHPTVYTASRWKSPVGYKQGNDKWELPLRRLPARVQREDIWRVSFYYKHRTSHERKEEPQGRKA